MGWLKTVSEAAGNTLIKDMLHARVGGSEPARGQTTIHASDLTKEDPAYCPRAVRLAEMQDPPPRRPSQFLPVALAVTFSEGRDKQKRLNEDWLVDVMYGDWKCLSCEEVRAFCLKPPVECEDHLHVWQYEEPRVLDHASKTSGGLDGIVDVGKEKLHLIECKIMKGDNFKKLVAPLSEHRVRTRLYLRQIAGSKQAFASKVNTDYAHILYIMRGHGCKQDDGKGISPFKEFIVERDDSEVEHYLGMAHALTVSRADSDLMPAGVCDTMVCPRAKNCPVSKICFSGENPGNVSWYKKGEPVHTGSDIKHVSNGEQLNECTSE